MTHGSASPYHTHMAEAIRQPPATSQTASVDQSSGESRSSSSKVHGNGPLHAELLPIIPHAFLVHNTGSLMNIAGTHQQPETYLVETPSDNYKHKDYCGRSYPIKQEKAQCDAWDLCYGKTNVDSNRKRSVKFAVHTEVVSFRRVHASEYEPIPSFVPIPRNEQQQQWAAERKWAKQWRRQCLTRKSVYEGYGEPQVMKLPGQFEETLSLIHI